MMKRVCAALAALGGLVYANSAAAEAGDSMLVLDGSGSMWGQIEGEAKITIAKQVLGDLLKDLPADRRLGLMAYGHNRKGDCADIEEIAPVGADRAAISAAVQGISPKGKTPMADSIKLAAEKLKYTEQKATVILISDGIETCEPDPCGVAAALEAAGVDFTAHVIGFDVTEENEQAQLRCLAENTGGTFVSASNAGELSEALEQTVVEVQESEPQQNLWLRATELEGGVVIENGLTWTVTPSAGGDPIISEENAGEISTTVEAGEYDVSVVRPSDGLTGEAKGVVIYNNAQKTVTIALTFPVEASVRVEPESAMAGSTVKIYWEGPNRQGDYIGITGVDADNHYENGYQYTMQGNPVEMRLPVEAGEYEIRYLLGRPIRNLAMTKVTVTAASATLTAQDSAAAGEEVEVEFTGPPPANGDYITVTEVGAPDKAYKSYHYTHSGNPAKVKMPLEPGDYEIRFVQAGTKVLARRPITVTEAAAAINAPETAKVGETITVTYTAAADPTGDYITVTEPDANPKKYNDYAYTSTGRPAEIRMPFEPGEYEIRYLQDGAVILARQTIIVEAVESSVSAKASAIAGETVSVEFVGPPAGSGDYIVVSKPSDPPKKYSGYGYVSRGTPAEVRMPFDAGEYEIRYLQGGSVIVARQTITITPASASFTDAPASAVAGTVVNIGYNGPPPGRSDYISVAEVGSADTKYVTYGYAKSSPAKVRMPSEPGDYELRFIQGDTNVLARKPITVTAE